MNYKKCVYCGKIIKKVSKEHIIQNAIGGLYESEEICCEACNNFVSKEIDKKFTKKFNFVISNINLMKSNKKNSKTSYYGKAMYDGNIYEVLIKNGKIVSCPDLCRELKCNISKLNMKIVDEGIKVDFDEDFRNGITKIAFNYAIDNGIEFEDVKDGVEIEKDSNGNLKKLCFNYQIVPFVPMNSFDSFMELYAQKDLYHSLILFSQKNNLWCYVDLFNTFQYYILLSSSWKKGNKNESYMQLINKRNREVDDLWIERPKDIMTYSAMYDIAPCSDVKKIETSIREKVRKAPNEIDSIEFFRSFCGKYIVWGLKNKGKAYREEIEQCCQLYYDYDLTIKKEKYKVVTYSAVGMNTDISYPLKILNEGKEMIEKYQNEKIERLNKIIKHSGK